MNENSAKADLTIGRKVLLKNFKHIEGMYTLPYIKIAKMERMIVEWKAKYKNAPLPSEFFKIANLKAMTKWLETRIALPPPTKYIYVETVEEAEAWADRRFINANYGDQLHIANYVNNALNELLLKGIKIPKNISCIEKITIRNLVGYYPPEDILFINKEARIFFGKNEEKVEKFIKSMYKRNCYSSNHKNHIIYHELGHYNHYISSKTRYKNAVDKPCCNELKELIIKEVSITASINYREFVAEVFAGLLSGKRYNDDIMRDYWKIGRME